MVSAMSVGVPILAEPVIPERRYNSRIVGFSCLTRSRSWALILRIRAKNPPISEQVAINYRKADLTERQKAMLDFALKVSRSAETVGEADFDVLKSHGFDEEDIWDIAAIAAFFALSNRMANVTAMRPNAEFYTMGRS